MSKRKDPIVITYTNNALSPDSTPSDNCAELTFQDDLDSLQPLALQNTQPGDVYEVRLTTNVPEVYNTNGNLCGRIVSVNSTKLVACLKKGHPFKAIIMHVTPSVCTVVIESAKQ